MLDEKEYLQGTTKLPYWRRLAYFWIHVIKSFQRNRGPVRAAAALACFMASLYFSDNVFRELGVSALKPTATEPAK